jgi:Zn-dependent peptidase ImmA (M78 family)
MAGIFRLFRFSECVMLADISCEELAWSLDAVAEDLLEEAEIAGPPVDAFALAARLGIAVAPDNRQSGRARYVRLRNWTGSGPQPAILLRADARPEREHWAVAHEIGEHAAHRVFQRLGVDIACLPAAREQTANDLAARVLLPGTWFFNDARACRWNIPALKRRYRTASHELIARRMLDAEPSIVISVFDHGILTFRRGNRAGDLPPITGAERSCQAKTHRTGLACTAAEIGCTIDAWPIHEPGWRREILRMEVDEYCDAWDSVA